MLAAVVCNDWATRLISGIYLSGDLDKVIGAAAILKALIGEVDRFSGWGLANAESRRFPKISLSWVLVMFTEAL